MLRFQHRDDALTYRNGAFTVVQRDKVVLQDMTGRAVRSVSQVAITHDRVDGADRTTKAERDKFTSCLPKSLVNHVTSEVTYEVTGTLRNQFPILGINGAFAEVDSRPMSSSPMVEAIKTALTCASSGALVGALLAVALAGASAAASWAAIGGCIVGAVAGLAQLATCSTSQSLRAFVDDVNALLHLLRSHHVTAASVNHYKQMLRAASTDAQVNLLRSVATACREHFGADAAAPILALSPPIVRAPANGNPLQPPILPVGQFYSGGSR